MGRLLDFRHYTYRLVLFVLLCLEQVERVITVSTKTYYDKYNKYVCVYCPFSCHSILEMLKRVYVCTTWRFPFVVHTWYITDGWVHSKRAYGHASSVWGYRRSMSSFRVYSAICDVSVVYNALQQMETAM